MMAPDIVNATCSSCRPNAIAWYAAHTRSRHEKCVADHLAARSVEFFLPVVRSRHRWNDRTRVVEQPLLPGYLFVHIKLQDRLKALEVPGVVRLLSFQGRPIALPDYEIQQIQSAVHANLRMDPYPYLKVGSRARVIRGPLEGAEGYVVRNKGEFRVVISLEMLSRSIAVEMDASDIEAVTEVFKSPTENQLRFCGPNQFSSALSSTPNWSAMLDKRT